LFIPQKKIKKKRYCIPTLPVWFRKFEKFDVLANFKHV